MWTFWCFYFYFIQFFFSLLLFPFYSFFFFIQFYAALYYICCKWDFLSFICCYNLVSINKASPPKIFSYYYYSPYFTWFGFVAAAFAEEKKKTETPTIIKKLDKIIHHPTRNKFKTNIEKRTRCWVRRTLVLDNSVLVLYYRETDSKIVFFFTKLYWDIYKLWEEQRL